MPAWQRDQVAAQAREIWGLSRKQVRDRVNRGTYQPLGPDLGRTIPRGRGGQLLERQDLLREQALQRLEGLFGGRLRWHPGTQEELLRQASPEQLHRILDATDEELTAAVGRRPEPDDWFWLPGDRNVLWYG